MKQVYLLLLQVALEYAKKEGNDNIRVLKLDYNRGKGGAIRIVSNIVKNFINLIMFYLFMKSSVNLRNWIPFDNI